MIKNLILLFFTSATPCGNTKQTGLMMLVTATQKCTLLDLSKPTSTGKTPTTSSKAKVSSKQSIKTADTHTTDDTE